MESITRDQLAAALADLHWTTFGEGALYANNLFEAAERLSADDEILATEVADFRRLTEVKARASLRVSVGKEALDNLIAYANDMRMSHASDHFCNKAEWLESESELETLVESLRALDYVSRLLDL